MSPIIEKHRNYPGVASLRDLPQAKVSLAFSQQNFGHKIVCDPDIDHVLASGVGAIKVVQMCATGSASVKLQQT